MERIDKDVEQSKTELFKDKKIKNGWTLNIFKQNDEILSTSLYNCFGQMIENKVFLLQKSEDVDQLRICFFVWRWPR